MFEEDLDEDESEQEDILEEKKRYISPVLGLNPEEYPIGHKVYDVFENCVCGKKIKPYFKIIKVMSPVKDENKEIVYKDGKMLTKEAKRWHRVGYPELFCHCNCGKKFKEHYHSEYTDEILEKQIKQNCVSCNKPLRNTLAKFKIKGNYCGNCYDY